MTTIPPEITPEELTSTHDMVEIRANEDLDWQPEYISQSRTLYGKSKDVKFRRNVWCLEFSFKPVRMIEVDLPLPTGRTVRKRIWYMIYRVENTGAVLSPQQQADGSFTGQPAQGKPVRFIPHFVLEGHDRDPSGRRIYKAYLDRVLPAALEPIRRRETPGRRLLDSAQMAEQMLPLSEGRTNRSVWGVATWEDVDPRMDFFSVYVAGLTNAYRWADPRGAYQKGNWPGTGRRFARKTLQLNFWRPGDEYLQHEKEFRYGVPRGKAHLYDVPEGVAHTWVYR